MINKAFDKRKISIKKTKIDKDKDTEETSENIIEIEEESPDLINKEIDYGDEGKGMKINNNEMIEMIDNKQDPTQQIFASDIPADEWMREVEKVSSKLKIEYSNNSFNTAEWRNHIDSIKLNEQNFSKSIPDTRSILENLSVDIDRSLEKIIRKEGLISKNYSNIVIFDYNFRRFQTTTKDIKRRLNN